MNTTRKKATKSQISGTLLVLRILAQLLDKAMAVANRKTGSLVKTIVKNLSSLGMQKAANKVLLIMSKMVSMTPTLLHFRQMKTV